MLVEYTLLKSSHIYIYLASTIQVPWLSTSHPTLNFHKQSLPGREPGWLRSKMSAMIVGLQCHNSIAGLISQDHFKKKHGSHQQDWKTGFPFGWFEKKNGPKSEIGRMVAGVSHHHLHRKCHLPVSFEACAIAATGFFCHTQDALTKSLAKGCWVVCVCDCTILRGFL